MSKKIYLAASACVATLMMASAANAVNVVDIYGTYTDSVTNVSSGTGPTIDTSTGLTPGNASTHTYFNVDNLTVNGPASSGNLFTVDPAGSGSGTVTADINVTFDFYGSTNNLLGTLTDSALGTFKYSNQTDNLCWLDGSVSATGGILVSHSAQPSCNAPGTGASNGYEKITVALNGSTYIIDLGDWSDWNESPNISFQLTCNTNCGANPGGNPVPEPLTLSLFGAGLAGAAALRRRKKKAA